MAILLIWKMGCQGENLGVELGMQSRPPHFPLLRPHYFGASPHFSFVSIFVSICLLTSPSSISKTLTSF